MKLGKGFEMEFLTFFGSTLDFFKDVSIKYPQFHLDFWLIFGFIGQAMFTMRFLIQWIASEKRKESVIPVSFWYFSLAGGLIVLSYAIHRLDPVFILAYLPGNFIYLRNLYFLYKKKRVHSHSAQIIKVGCYGEQTDGLAEKDSKGSALYWSFLVRGFAKPQFPWILIGMILILAGQLATIFTSVRLKISI